MRTGIPVRLGRQPHGLEAVDSGAAFSPLNVSGLAAWYDFSDPTTLYTDTGRTTLVSADGNTIKGVTDKSGAGNHFSDTTGVPYKVSRVNGLSTALFDTGNKLGSDTAKAIVSQPDTIFAVFKASSLPADNRIIDGSSTGTSRQLFGYQTNGTKYVMYAGTVQAISATPGLTTHVFAVIFNGASSKLYADGGAPLTPAASPGTQSWGDGTTKAYIGSDNASTYAMGDMCEVVAYAGALSTPNLDAVGRYLANKWGTAWSAAS